MPDYVDILFRRIDLGERALLFESHSEIRDGARCVGCDERYPCRFICLILTCDELHGQRDVAIARAERAEAALRGIAAQRGLATRVQGADEYSRGFTVGSIDGRERAADIAELALREAGGG